MPASTSMTPTRTLAGFPLLRVRQPPERRLQQFLAELVLFRVTPDRLMASW